MAKKIIKRPKSPDSDEIEEVEVENGDEASPPPVEGEIPSQSVPYPTGGTYKPPLEYLAEETAPAPEAARAKAPAPSTEDDFDEPFRKGKK